MHSLETLLAYLPSDRVQAIAAGNEIPHRAQGAALWADLSGFTPLTEILTHKLGPRHGAEELALQLNRFYDALLAPIGHYGGSVVGFSGDAVVCWFDADDGRRAIAAAQAMQVAMQPFVSLQLGPGEGIPMGLKTAVASGAVRRLRVGDPVVQTIDTLAGATLDRLAEVGYLARAGELLVDEETQARLRKLLRIGKWRTGKETGRRAAVVSSLKAPVELLPQASQLPPLTEEQVRPWLLPAVFARLQSGLGEFLTELRPAVALFMRFEGLDYEGDEQVGDKLDVVIRQVQSILLKYDGTLLQLTIGDKGSYLYAAFGAPVAHEDDAVRAVAAALELSELPARPNSIRSAAIGLSRGTMRTGAYGSASRRTYGVLGDEVNLAARLMEQAAPGQVLASKAVWQATLPDFNWEALPALKVKGKRAAVAVAALLGRSAQDRLQLPQVTAALPMVGRRAELALVLEKLELARAGQGQIVSILAEAGMGKSRLLAEVLQRAGAQNPTWYGGECQSYGTHSSYLVWQPIWRAFFGLDPAGSTEQQIGTLQKALAGAIPDFPERLPVLGAALNLSIPDSALTGAMDARARKTLRETLLVDCLRARAVSQHLPLVLILEDAHWIDPLSRDLLELIAQVIEDLPVLILLAYRPPTEAPAAGFLPGLKGLKHATEIRLAELSGPETEQLVAARLADFGLEGAAPPGLVERMLSRAQGNPFYIGELLNYLHDRGLDPRHEASWQQADLPDSLQSLILSRIDQLSEQQQITIKAASIIGRLFRVAWLYGYYPALGSPSTVAADLQVLSRLDFTVLETPEPQLAYLFKHVITQEVAYESLAYATRANLHEQLAGYLEQSAGQDLRPFLDLLAYHYERSQNLPKKREYLLKAGEAAQAAYANEAALSYLGRALALAPETDHAERFDILVAREKVYTFIGRQEARYEDVIALSALAEAMDDNKRRAQAQIIRSIFGQSISDYPAAAAAAQQAVEFAHLAGADELETHGHWLGGVVLFIQGDYAQARTRYEQALALAQTAGLTRLSADILTSLGTLEFSTSETDRAQVHLERALQLQREIGNRAGEALALSYLGENALSRVDYAQAQTYGEQALHAWHSMGYKQNEGMSLGRLGNLIVEQRGDYEKAWAYCDRALRLSLASGDRIGEMGILYTLSLVSQLQNNYPVAREQADQALRICREAGIKLYEAICLSQRGSVSSELGQYDAALEDQNQGLAIFREIGDPNGISQMFAALGMVYYQSGRHELAHENGRQALTFADQAKNKLAQNRAHVLLGHALNDLDDLEAAAAAYRQALDLALELRLPHLVMPVRAALAGIALARGNPDEARVALDEILPYLETHALSTVDELSRIYLTCYRILQAGADPRARATLNAGYRLLQEIAGKITDQGLRASFLQNVRFNREIVQAWEGLAAS